DAAGGDAADHRHVVGAVDGDADELAGGAVEGDRGEAVGERSEERRVGEECRAGGGRVAPVDGGVEGEGTVGPGGAGLRHEARLALVDIGDRQGYAGCQVVAVVGLDFLADAAGGDAADHRHVVGAVDGDADELAGGAVEGDRGEAVGE